jgi:L-seryl-tRNA(Ser) seleniumtransferase
MTNESLRSLPSIDWMLARMLGTQLSAEFGRDRVRDLLREITDEIRRELASRELASITGDTEDEGGLATRLTLEIEKRLESRAARERTPSLRRVINATGVIIHTNLGRAPLAASAIEAVSNVAGYYSNLEYDVDAGERGRREQHCRDLMARLTGSEAAVVVNNNAAAVLLVLNTLADGGEVVVSRGELIEIGGSFRIPDVMEKSGARLREVGTTNRTRIQDYQRAINEHTRLILRVHPSNFRIVGFTERPTTEEVAELARKAGIPSFEDLGSGCLIDFSSWGVKDEPVVADSLKAGISVVSFSGDKMLGGPQAGIIAGATDLVQRIAKNPLMRALRCDKMTYAALEHTLRLYERGQALLRIPVVRAITATREQLEERAVRFRDAVHAQTGGRITPGLEDGDSVIGGGSAPEVKLPTVLIAIEDTELSAADIERSLRTAALPIISRAERGRVLLDLRTVAEDEEPFIVKALGELFAAQRPGNRIASVEA